jgi:hypothetical protein
LKKPEKVSFDGSSLRPLLEDKGDWPERTLFVHSQRIDHPEKWRKCAVMTDRWRLINGKELYDSNVDPGQQKDVAARHAAVVAELRREYERWFADLSKRFDEYCHIVVGSAQENPVNLCCHDWHGENAPSGQEAVRRCVHANGFWALEIARPGNYEVTLRQEPAGADFPIQAATARLKIGANELSQAVPAHATSLRFAIKLQAGQTRLQTWLNDGRNDLRGAYYVEVRYVE